MLDLFGTDHAPPPKTKEQEYKEYLASAAWNLKRKQAIHRAGNKCEVCAVPGTARKLEVHHKTYDRFRHERLDDLQVLCKPCHDEQDAKRRRQVKYRNAHALEEAQLDGWATKVFGQDRHGMHPVELQRAFDKWRERKGYS